MQLAHSLQPAHSPPTLPRRTAISRILTATAAIALTPRQFSAASAPKPKGNWPISLGLNGFDSGSNKYRRTYPIWEILEFLAQHRFDGVELVSSWPMGPYPQATQADKIRALRGLYDRYNLRIAALQWGAADAFSPDPEARRTWVSGFASLAQVAAKLGASVIGLWPGGGLRGQTLAEAIQRLSDSFRAAAKIGIDNGLLVAFEIEPPFVFNRGEHITQILESTNHPNLKTIYDPSHFDLMNGSTGRPHELLQRIGVENIGYIHLTDTDGTLRDGGTSKHLAVGDGHAQIETSLQVLKAGGYKGWVNIDTWEIPDPYDAALKAQAAIRKARR